MKMIDTTHWKEFKIKDVFHVKGGFYNKKPEHSLIGNIPFLAATESNNGVTEYYSIDDIKEWDKVGNPDNTINNKIFKTPSIAVTVNGSVCNAFYQNTDYTCSHDITSLIPKGNHQLTPEEALFCCSIIQNEKYRWSYGRKPHDVKKFSKMIIKLPAAADGNPDWQYMENYIKSLHSKPITTVNKSVASTIDTTSWQEFKFKNLISSISKAKAHTKEEVEECPYYENDAIPFVSRTESNNSVDIIVHSTDLEGIEKGNAIVIGDTTSTISYQAEDFVAGDHIVVIRAPWLTLYTGLFIVSVLRKERYRYSYGRAYTVDSIKNTILKLPTTAEGKPDWIWMENYIKSLPFSDRIS